MWKNNAEPDRFKMAIWRMRISRYVPKTTQTHTHTRTMQYFLLFCSSDGFTNAPQRYVLRTLPVLSPVSTECF